MHSHSDIGYTAMELYDLPAGEYIVTTSTTANHRGPFTITASVDNDQFTFTKQQQKLTANY